MTKLATITPINCITHEQDGEAFSVLWDCETGALYADFESGQQEMDYTAQTLDKAVDTVYSLYAPSNAFIYEPEDVARDVERRGM